MLEANIVFKLLLENVHAIVCNLMNARIVYLHKNNLAAENISNYRLNKVQCMSERGGDCSANCT